MELVTEIPIFPLRSVLCPGVALPLHIFEERYRLMIGRCIERGEPFGVVLLREGHEVGPLRGQIAAVGTTAAIRRAGAYPDGRLDILTVGQQRFRLEDLDSVSQPYLLGRVSWLDEPTGPEPALGDRAQRVGQRFLEYLELLQPVDETDGPEIEIEFEIEMELAEGGHDDVEPGVSGESDAEGTVDAEDAVDVVDAQDAVDRVDADRLDANIADISSEQRRKLLMAAARRLTGTDDPTALSYVLTALIQVDLAVRQELLEAPDTLERLARLNGLLTRESWFLRQGLRPIIIDARLAGGRPG
jgi:Lon protease-like protein